jgi:Putative zinc-finger
MTCGEARDRFSARADDALAPDERAALEAHLATCGECRRDWQRFAATVGLLHAVEPARAPAGFVDRVLGAARPAPWYRRLARTVFLPWPVKLPLEAAAIVLVGGLAVLVFQRSPALQYTAQAPTSETRSQVAPSPTPDAGARSRAILEERRAELEKQAMPATPPADSRDAAPRAMADAARSESAPSSVNPQGPQELLAARRGLPAEQPALTRRAVAPSPGAATSGYVSPEARAKSEEPRGAELTGKERDALKRAGSLAETSVRVVQPAVELRLAVADRAAAEREITGVVERLGGALVADPATATLEIMVPPQAFPALTGELARLGTLRVVRQPTELPPTVRVSVQLTD